MLVILGPTGSGKSDLGLNLAADLGGEIVNYDSLQVHRGLDIGTAKVPPAERRGVPHHLLDILNPDEELNAGEYGRLARDVLNDLRGRGKLPVLVGGTGFYLRALLDGLSPAPLRNAAVRERLRAISKRRPVALHRFLRRRDPLAAERIHPNDLQKIIRAIEIVLEAGRPATEVQSAERDELRSFASLKIGLAPDRGALQDRLNARTVRMFASGLIREVERLMAAGVSPESKALQSIGYKQAVSYIQGSLTLEQAISECQARTRQYAKRQMTWGRSDRDVHWIMGFGEEEHVQRHAERVAREFLLSHSGK